MILIWKSCVTSSKIKKKVFEITYLYLDVTWMWMYYMTVATRVLKLALSCAAYTKSSSGQFLESWLSQERRGRPRG